MATVMKTLLSWSPLSKKTRSVESTAPSPAASPPPDVIAESISSAESALVSLQRLAVWERPVNSLMALLAANLACWLVFAYELRPVFVLSVAALFRLVRTEWRERIWPEIRVPPPVPEDTEPWTDVSEGVLSAPELIHYVKRLRAALHSLVSSLTELRATTPFMFFLAVNSMWTALYVLSRCFSAALLCHLLLSLGLTLPGVLLHWVPDSAWQRLQQIVTDGRRSVVNSGLLQDEDCERDFLPETSPETQAYLDAMADIINGREPSPDCHEVAAFSSGLAAAPGYDEESEDDLLAPSVDRPGELDLDSAPAAAAAPAPALQLLSSAAAAVGATDSTPAAAAPAPALQLLSSAAAAVGAVSRAAGQMVAASVGPGPQPVREDSDSEFELIGEEEALAAAHR